ncbi:MAG: N-acetylmuramoyl-L-alanine amidase [Bacteroidetes bacterium]|nr:MAG: N-acetylmuramoyl-L-alanine amidase [Bacteroidota bacterium]TAE68669.1 MAG: N-acetylmuramoyl-L-alanine amidase [Bacteroidota bacterium]TAF93523.1 MAG: N-acetylmuramoyl-L-alanine amidase [Bacteroidota bacterium]
MRSVITLVTCMFFSQVYGQLLKGKTIGKLPYLQYTMGEDRLGAAKMTYLDTSVQLVIMDSLKDYYKIQLAQSQLAFIPKSNCELQGVFTNTGIRVAGNSRVWGDSLYDYVTLSLDARLPYKTTQEIHNNAIVVDVYGVASNTNWITHLTTAQTIRQVWQEQISADVLRLHIELNTTTHWGYGVYYNRNQLVIKCKRPPTTPKQVFIAIDAGHGGSNSGATGKLTRVLEKDLTLLYAEALQKELIKMYPNICLVRSHDTDVSMIDRTLLLRAVNPTLLISVHFNSSGNDTVKGVSTFYRYPGFKPLANAIIKQVLADTDLKEFGEVGQFNFALSGPTEYPNALWEVAFISNAEDEAKVVNPAYRKKLVVAAAKGVTNYLTNFAVLKNTPNGKQKKSPKKK